MTSQNSPQIIKKAKKNQTSLIALAKRFYSLYRPYFGFKNAKNRARTFKAGFILFNSVLSAFTMSLINSTMNAFIGVLGMSGVTYSAYFLSLGGFFGAILLYCAINVLNTWLTSSLGESLSHAINKQFGKTWLKTKAFFGTKFVTNKNNELNPAQIMSHDNQELNRDALELSNQFLMTFGNFAVGAIGLYNLSIPLTFTVFATTVTIPAFMLISTLAYALIYNYLTTKTGQSLQSQLKKQSHAESEYHQKIHHINTRSEAIAFKRGANNESQTLLKTIKKNRAVQITLTKVRTALTFLNVFSRDFSQLISYILASPSIIAGKLGMTQMFELSNNFGFVTQMFTWKSDNFDKLTQCEVTLTKMEKLNKQLDKWKQIKAVSKTKLFFTQKRHTRRSNQGVEIKNLTLRKPDGAPILNNFNTTLEKGKITLIKGKSGMGKTSILRALAGMNPLASGEIINLPKNAHFVPSEPYFPHEQSLMDAVIYPRTTPATTTEIHFVRQLMKEMGFEQSKIKDLLKVKDWYGSTLSDGERKRMMLICAIIKNPSFLVIDEGTRGIDPPTKLKVEKCIKKHLPETTIVFTDHNPSKNKRFYNRKIKLG